MVNTRSRSSSSTPSTPLLRRSKIVRVRQPNDSSLSPLSMPTQEAGTPDQSSSTSLLQTAVALASVGDPETDTATTSGDMETVGKFRSSHNDSSKTEARQPSLVAGATGYEAEADEDVEMENEGASNDINDVLKPLGNLPRGVGSSTLDASALAKQSVAPATPTTMSQRDEWRPPPQAKEYLEDTQLPAVDTTS